MFGEDQSTGGLSGNHHPRASAQAVGWFHPAEHESHCQGFFWQRERERDNKQQQAKRTNRKPLLSISPSLPTPLPPGIKSGQQWARRFVLFIYLIPSKNDLVDTCLAGDDIKVVGIVRQMWGPLWKDKVCELENVIEAYHLNVLSNSKHSG